MKKEEIVKKRVKSITQPQIKPQSYSNLYKSIRNLLEDDVPRLGQNLFIELVERISKELNVTNCWICGGALMTEE